jgi:hypothetical protein
VAQERSDPAKTVDASKPDIDDPTLLAQQAREGIEKSAAELRKTRVPIATEPPTVFRP